MTDHEHPWLGGVQTDPSEVQEIYNGWADGYDDDVATWGYEVPAIVARLLLQLQPNAAPVLDAGCGTGLAGRALREAGFTDVVGIDLSPASLELAAATGAYRQVHAVDLQDLPTRFDDDAFAALTCVGVLTYLPHFEATMAEFCRLVAPGGVVAVTQRHDLWQERGCQESLGRLAADGHCEIVDVSMPQDYLPGHETANDMRVRVISLRAGPVPGSPA